MTVLVQVAHPVRRDAPGRPGHGLVCRMRLGRGQLRSGDCGILRIAVKPVFTRFITADNRMPGGLFVGRGVLAR